MMSSNKQQSFVFIKSIEIEKSIAAILRYLETLVAPSFCFHLLRFPFDLFRSIDVKCCYQLCLFMHIQVQLEILMSACLLLVRQHSTVDPCSVVSSQILLFKNKSL